MSAEANPRALTARDVDRHCCEFENLWQQGKRVCVEDYLSDVRVSANSVLIINLLGTELESRAIREPCPELVEFTIRFPQWTTELYEAWQGTFHPPQSLLSKFLAKQIMQICMQVGVSSIAKCRVLHLIDSPELGFDDNALLNEWKSSQVG